MRRICPGCCRGGVICREGGSLALAGSRRGIGLRSRVFVLLLVRLILLAVEQIQVIA